MNYNSKVILHNMGLVVKSTSSLLTLTSYLPKIKIFLEKSEECRCNSEKVKIPILKNEDFWQGWQDLNLRMTESKSVALPLGYTPSYR